MNGNDIFTALSGLDPKYIDEAAFELKKSDTPKKNSKVVSIRRILYIAVPSAAAILLILAVSLPAVLRVSKSESAATAPSEAPSYDAAAEAEMPADEEAASEAADETAEPEAASETAAEATAEAADEASQTETAGAPMYDEEINSEAAADELMTEQAKRADIEPISGASAKYDNGVLTVILPDTVIYDMNSSYSILESDQPDAKTLQEGILKDVATGSDPLTLDISKLDLQSGTYTLKICDETIEFSVL